MKRGKSKEASKAINSLEIIEEKRLKKTLIITTIVSLIVIISVILIQLLGQSKIVQGCSYLDPMTIDLLAFCAALFLVIEGFARILEHPNATIPRQSTRMIRIAFGFAIITLHIIQVIHK